MDSWYAQWMEVYKYEVRDSTRLQYSIVFCKHIGPALGTIPLAQLTTLDVTRFLNNMKKRGLSFEVRNKARIGDDKKTFHIHPPKTEASFRKVYFDERCGLALNSKFRKKSNISLRETAMPLPGLEDLLFVSKYNTPLNSSLYSSAIQRIVDLINESRCQIEQFEPFSGHCFRHTYATRCFEAGVDPKVVQKQLGHASIKMTLYLYTHLFEDKHISELTKFSAHSEQMFSASDALKEKCYLETQDPKTVNLN